MGAAVKPKFDYPTSVKTVVKTSKNLFSKQKRSLRPSLSAGTIAIILAGAHKGKRVIVLKLLATKTSVDVSAVKVPEHINDVYFKRAKKAAKARKEGDIFEAKKEEYKPSEQRKTD